MKLEIRDLGMEFHDGSRVVKVFSALNYLFESGTSTAIIGESGVGKSTLLYLLGGLEAPTQGDVLFDNLSLLAKQRKGEDIAPYRGEHVGFVFQAHHLLPEFDAVENVSLPLLIRGVGRQAARERAEELLKKVGLGERLTHRPGQLSGGEQQRVAIARSISGRPGVLLADEPTGNLDINTGREVIDVLLELQRSEGSTLIVVTHSHELARRMDKIVELRPHSLIPREDLKDA